MLRSVIGVYREAFRGLPREVWLLAAVCLVNRAGTMVVPFMMLYLTGPRGMTTSEAGLFLGIYGLGSIVGTFAGGWATDRIGGRRVMATSLATTGVGFFVLGRLSQPLAIAVALFAVAFLSDMFRPANAAAIAARCTDENRGRGFALYRLAINLGMSIGPALGGFLAERSYRLIFDIDAATCLAAAVLLIATTSSRRAAVDDDDPSGPAPGRVWHDGVFLVFLVLMVLLTTVFMQWESTFSIFLRDVYGFRESRIGAMLVINTILIVLFEMVVVSRLERRRPLPVLAVGAVLMGSGFAVLTLGIGTAFAATSVVLWTFGEMFTMPLGTSFVARRAPPRQRGQYLALFSVTFSLGFSLAPMVGGFVYERSGPTSLWLGCLAVSLLAAVGFFAIGRHLRAASPSH